MIQELKQLIKEWRRDVNSWAKSDSLLKQWGNHLITAGMHVVIVLVVSALGLVLSFIWGPLFPILVISIVGFYFWRDWFNFLEYKAGLGGHYEHTIGFVLDWALPLIVMFVLIGGWLARLTYPN